MRENGVSRVGYTKQLVLRLEVEEMGLTVETKVVKVVVDGGCLSARSSQGGGRARLNECRQVVIVKEHRRGVSDYRPDRSVTGSIEGRAER